MTDLNIIQSLENERDELQLELDALRDAFKNLSNERWLFSEKQTKEVYALALRGQEVRGLVDALEKISNQKMINLSDNLHERVMQVSGLWVSLKRTAHDALEKFKRPKENI